MLESEHAVTLGFTREAERRAGKEATVIQPIVGVMSSLSIIETTLSTFREVFTLLDDHEAKYGTGGKGVVLAPKGYDG